MKKKIGKGKRVDCVLHSDKSIYCAMGTASPFVNECISMFRNGIAVYVNGEIRGSWFVQDCEERRRFIPQKETSLMSRKQIAAYNKMPKKRPGTA